MTENIDNTGLGIAIIGMAGRFPGASSVDRFWKNLCNGVESIDRFSREDLEAFGINSLDIERPGFVPVAPVLEDADCFDASFFGYSPREAELMDPQQRVFLECSWHALEAAGYPPGHCPALTAIYGGTSLSSYLLYNVLPALNGPHAEETLQAMIANDKDFLSTRVSYKLNLCGPSVDVQTGCSTSLVAIHFASQALLSYQCDLALAGGVSVQVPQRRGYLFQKGALYSPDGHCRPFDAAAEGTLFGSGVGLVVLKRLDQAVADGDHIHAILRATAINNDGNAKVGYTAPSIRGQSEVIRLAHAYAEVTPDSIGYVECHGTGTPLGDPAELTALTKAFRATTQKKNFCGIGSVKSNIGHLDAAAGVASFIKATLAVEHGVIPPSLHFLEPHPDLGLEDSPFYVNARLSQWPAMNGPRRAGVSSFGIGGTNAHVVLEQPPATPAHPSARTAHALTLSAKSKRSLERLIAAIASDLEEEPKKNFADVAYTTQVSRSQLPFRCAVVSHDAEEAVKVIRDREQGRLYIGLASQKPHRIVFMFPGGGSQHVNMAADLYREDGRFRETLDPLLSDAKAHLGFDLRAYLFPMSDLTRAEAGIRDPLIGLTALFLVEYALAEFCIQWGIRPDACIGHSLGEYVAACIAGILSVGDALALLITRSRLLGQLPAGAMLSVPLSVEEVSPLLGTDLSIAAVNGPSQTVVSGGAESIKSLATRLLNQDIESRQLQIAVSSHSHMVEPVLSEFRQFARTLKPRVPTIPYISNVTGDWLSPEEASDPEYWVSHLRQPVLFGKGVGTLIGDPQTILLEVGPGTALTTLVQTQFGSAGSARAIAMMRHPYDRISDCKAILSAAAQLWTAGVAVDWAWLYAEEKRCRVSLPTYPFERRRFWLQNDEFGGDQVRKAENLPRSRWLHRRMWTGGNRQQAFQNPRLQRQPTIAVGGRASLLAQAVQEKLHSSGCNVLRLENNRHFGGLAKDDWPPGVEPYGENVTKGHAPEDDSAYDSILYFATSDPAHPRPAAAESDPMGHLEDLLRTMKSLGQSGPATHFSLTVIADGICGVHDDDPIQPWNSWVAALATVAEQEFPNLRVRLVDIDPRETRMEATVEGICDELVNPDTSAIVAVRGYRTWRRVYEPVRLSVESSGPGLRQNGVYLITGGLGRIGLELATFLARSKRANLVLLTRTTLPERTSWARILASEPDDSNRVRRIHGIERIEALGSQVLLLNADVANREEVTKAFEAVEHRFGALHGVFHLAGTTGPEAVQLISDATPRDIMEQSRAKARGALAIEDICKSLNLDFVFLFSSSAAYLGGTGLMAYSGANIFLDAIAQRNEGKSTTRWVSANWDAWVPGNSAEMNPLPKELLEYAIASEQGCQTVEEIISAGLQGPIVVSTAAPELRISRLKSRSSAERFPRARLDEDLPWDLDQPYSPPSNEVERAVTKLWEEVLGKSKVSIHDNFFEIGGTSLIALRLISRLKREMRIDVPIISLFEKPTVASFAALLSALQSNTDNRPMDGHDPRTSAFDPVDEPDSRSDEEVLPIRA